MIANDCACYYFLFNNFRPRSSNEQFVLNYYYFTSLEKLRL
jgi:hypothetical protein